MWRPSPDARALRAARQGDERELERLFRAYWPRAYRAAYLVVQDGGAAEDIAQEAFLTVVRTLDRFDTTRPFGPWLHRIVVNRAIDHARARAVRAESGPDALDHAPATPPDALDDRLLAGIGSLDPDQRAVVVLRYLLEYTPGEIADLLDLPRGTVNSRLRRGLDALRERLGEDLR